MARGKLARRRPAALLLHHDGHGRAHGPPANSQETCACRRQADEARAGDDGVPVQEHLDRRHLNSHTATCCEDCQVPALAWTNHMSMLER
jgi:hypothetical protein